MSDESDELVIHYKKGAAVKTLLVSLLFGIAAIGIDILCYTNPNKSLRSYLFIVLAPVAAFGCWLLFYGSARVLGKRLPALVVDENGVTSHSFVGSDTHPWSEIGGFALREQKEQKSDATLFLDVLGNTPDRKVICSIDADELPHRPNDVLYTLEELRTKHKEKQSDNSQSTPDTVHAAPLRRNPVAAATYGFVGFFLLGVVMAALPLTKQVTHLMQAKEGGGEATDSTALLDGELSQNPVTQAMKQVDPHRFAAFRSELLEASRRGISEEEMDAKIGALTNDFMQMRLQHASATTLCSYFRLQLSYQEEVAKVSPMTVYAILMKNGYQPGILSDREEEVLQNGEAKLMNDLARIIVAPPSDTPVPLDKTIIKKRLVAIYPKLTPDDWKLLNNKGQEALDSVSQEKYCAAYFHLCHAVLELPDGEAAQVLRFLGLLPLDDRIPAKDHS